MNFNKIIYSNVTYYINLNNQIKENKYMGPLHFSENTNIWFFRKKISNKHVYNFGFFDKNTNILKPNYPIFTIDFNNTVIYDKNTRGIFVKDKNNENHIAISHNYYKIDYTEDKNGNYLNEIFISNSKNNTKFFDLGAIKEEKFIDNIKKIMSEIDMKINYKQIINKPNKNKKCSICGNTKIDSKFTNTLLEKKAEKNSDQCIDCLEKILALETYNQIINYVPSSFGELNNVKKNFKNIDDFDYLYSLLIKYRMVTKIGTASFRLNEKKDIINKYKEFACENPLIKINEESVKDNVKNNFNTSETTINNPQKNDSSIIKSKNNKKCEICGSKLKPNNSKSICKKCNKKIKTAEKLKNLLNYMECEVPFKKQELLSIGLDDLQINDLIWTLQEENLIIENKEKNEFQLEKESILNDFIKKYDIKLDSTPTTNQIPSKMDKSKSLNKQCIICKKKFSINHFHKSKKTADGYDDFCRDCKRLVRTSNNLKELLKIVKPEESFLKEDITNNYSNNTMKLNEQIWSLQDNDLIDHDEKTGLYTLKSKNILEEFIDKYFVETKPESIINTESLIKENTAEVINVKKINNTETTNTEKINSENILDITNNDKKIEIEAMKNIKPKTDSITEVKTNKIIDSNNINKFKNINFFITNKTNEFVEIIIKGIIQVTELQNTLFKFKEFNTDINKIIIDRDDENYNNFLIEIRVNHSKLNETIEKLEKQGWNNKI